MREDGAMSAPPHNETGHTWHHDNQLLFNYTKYGGMKLFEAMGVTDMKSGMPGFGEKLSDKSIWDILGYIRSKWPKEVQDVQDNLNVPHN